MDTALTNNVWKQIAPKVCKAKRRVAAIAYVSSNKYVRFEDGDILVCDASDHAIASGQTSARVLQSFFNKRAQLYSYTGLHSKVLVFGKYALIGSTNLSASSATALRELALLSSRSAVRSQAAAFIHMTKEGSDVIDEAFVERIMKIKVSKRTAPLGKRKQNNRTVGNQTWVLRTHQIDPERYKHEEALVDKAEREVRTRIENPDTDIGWVRWTGKSRFRQTAQEGDTMIVMSSRRGGKQITVSAPTPILKRQHCKKWSRFYHEDSNGDHMSWTEFKAKLARLGITSIKKNSTRPLTKEEVALIDTLWDKDD